MINLAICAIIKDEREDYLREWIDYHLRIGVDFIHIYDNNSKIPIKGMLSDVSNLSVSRFTDTSGNRHPNAYNNFLNLFRGQVKWVAYIDADEFIVVRTKSARLDELLNNYSNYGGLGLNWLMFGSNGLTDNPSGSTIKAFTKRCDDHAIPNKHIKSIVQLEYTTSCIEGHCCRYGNGKYCVNDICQRIDGPFSILSYAHANINHYYSRSYNDFLDKIKRGASSNTPGTYTLEHYKNYLQCNALEDKTLYDIYEKLKHQDYNKFYNEKIYLENNPDVAKNMQTHNCLSGLSHWIYSGRHEGRKAI